ncbi:MAG: hypothetical protein K2M42_00255 [Oscillospiraceae bacterium]|nr:hypothetical protein [Oscillospiraceae bacterium]
MTLKKKLGRILMYCVCASLIISCCLFPIPVNAAEAPSEFDFSAVDSIDAYDEYKKEPFETSDGETVMRVRASLENRLPSSINDYPPNYYRYGAYLRNSDELQRYYFYNLEYTRSNTTVCYNTLTIYADPEVKFEVVNTMGQLVVDTDGVKAANLVEYYKKSSDNGHTVYFIELTPMQSGQSEYMVTFSTDSVDTCPHYSFWFGAPLTKKATVVLGTITLSVSARYTASAAYPLQSYGIPKRAWVNKVTIKKLSSTGDSYISRASLNVALPNTAINMVPSNVSSSPNVFDAIPSVVGTSDAQGTYKISLTNVSWLGTSYSGSYQYRGQVRMEYLYAFGA